MFLRQSTASQGRVLGAFTDSTGSPMTGLTIANTDIKLMKNGAASVNKNSGGGTHRANGDYGITLDATDTDTVGELRASCVMSGALPVWTTFFVLEENVYDFFFGATASNQGGGTVDGLSWLKVMQVLIAIAAGKVNGAGTATINFRDILDTVNRVQATDDVDGNRSAVTIT